MFNKPCLALDIGNRYIKIVYGRVIKKKVEVMHYDIIDTPPNVVRDGKIIDAKSIAGIISETVKKNKMKAKRLVMLVTGTGVITRDIVMPKSTESEIEKILEFEAPQYFPVDLQNYVLDFKVIEETINDEGVSDRVLLVAVPTRQVDEYMKIPDMLKMEMESIDLPANCISKFLFSTDPKQDKDVKIPAEFAVIDIGANTTAVCIFSNQKLKFSRILLSGGCEIDKLISNQFNTDFVQAEQVKLLIGKIIPEGMEQQESEEVMNVSETIKLAVNNMVTDINRFIEFYNSRTSNNRLEKVYICGGGSKLEGLSVYLSSYLNLPVDYLLSRDRVIFKEKKDPVVCEQDFTFLINALGALIRN